MRWWDRRRRIKVIKIQFKKEIGTSEGCIYSKDGKSVDKSLEKSINKSRVIAETKYYDLLVYPVEASVPAEEKDNAGTRYINFSMSNSQLRTVDYYKNLEWSEKNAFRFKVNDVKNELLTIQVYDKKAEGGIVGTGTFKVSSITAPTVTSTNFVFKAKTI